MQCKETPCKIEVGEAESHFAHAIIEPENKGGNGFSQTKKVAACQIGY